MTDVEKKLEQIEEELENDLEEMGEDTRKGVIESDGFLTKAGALVDRVEWHALAISTAWASLPFAFPTPLDAVFVITYALFMKKVINGEMFDGTQLGDPADQFAYSIVPYAITIWLFVEFTGYSIESIEVGRMLVAMFAGA